VNTATTREKKTWTAHGHERTYTKQINMPMKNIQMPVAVPPKV